MVHTSGRRKRLDELDGKTFCDEWAEISIRGAVLAKANLVDWGLSAGRILKVLSYTRTIESLVWMAESILKTFSVSGVEFIKSLRLAGDVRGSFFKDSVNSLTRRNYVNHAQKTRNISIRSLNKFSENSSLPIE